jgi:hypothetical protein
MRKTEMHEKVGVRGCQKCQNIKNNKDFTLVEML